MLRGSSLVLALPSKGRLQERAIAFLAQCGFVVRGSGSDREYSARLVGVQGIEIAYFRPDDIPTRIEHGDAHVGITGEDLYREYGDGPPVSHVLMRNLGFGVARLVVAVPQAWVDVSSIDEIDEIAMVYRQKHSRSLRIATKFPRLTRTFFAAHGIVDYRIVESLGATEGAPAAGIADFVVDLTSSGATLVQNHLKEVAGGTLLHTDACLIASQRESSWSDDTLGALEHLVEQVEASTRATSFSVLRFSLPPAGAESALAQLLAKDGCSLVSWHEDVAGTRAQRQAGKAQGVVLCRRDSIYDVVILLRSLGCDRVVANRCESLYEGPSHAIEGFRKLLRRHVSLGRRRDESDGSSSPQDA